jgi:hypothetical protein
VTEDEYRVVSPDSIVLVFLSDRGLLKKEVGSFRNTVMERSYKLPGENPPKYVRALMRDSNGKQALTQPVSVTDHMTDL